MPIIDIADQERFQVTESALKLYSAIEKGHKVGEENGWISEDAANNLIEEIIKSLVLIT